MFVSTLPAATTVVHFGYTAPSWLDTLLTYGHWEMGCSLHRTSELPVISDKIIKTCVVCTSSDILKLDKSFSTSGPNVRETIKELSEPAGRGWRLARGRRVLSRSPGFAPPPPPGRITPLRLHRYARAGRSARGQAAPPSRSGATPTSAAGPGRAGRLAGRPQKPSPVAGVDVHAPRAAGR